jgi:hypothetical protein
MVLFANCVFLALLLSNLFWKQPKMLRQPPKPLPATSATQRVIEFVCLAPLCCWVITLWVGMIAWLFFIGDRGSLFHDFFHYATFSTGLGLAAIMTFGYVKKSRAQWLMNSVVSLTVFVIVTFSGYSVLPEWDGLTADAAAARIANRRPVVANGSMISAAQCSLVPTDNPFFGGPFSSYDRTYLLIGPDQHAVSRITVRPFLPCYWTAKRTDNFAYAEEELQRAKTAHELVRIMDKYPRSKAAAIAEERYSRLHSRR